MVFTRKDGTYSGTDIIRYPFRIIHHKLGIQCRFYDLSGSYFVINLRNDTEFREVTDILYYKYIEIIENFYILGTDENKKNITTAFDKAMTFELIKNIIKYEIAY